jgi:hypothetical protein
MAVFPNSGEKVVVHLGLPKTGSKFLQHKFFTEITGTSYCDPKKTHKDFLTYFYLANEFEFSPRHAAQLYLQGCEGFAPSQNQVLSQESFYSVPWEGTVLRKRHCDRLAAIFPQAHVVLVLRNQPDMLRSLYLHYIKSGGTVPWKKFLDSRKHPLVMTVDYFKYGQYVDYLFSIFGKERVSVLFYEDFFNSPVAYLNSWCDILQAPKNSWDADILKTRENESISPHMVNFMRHLNKLTSSSKHPYLLLSKSWHGNVKKAMLMLSGWRRSRPRKPLLIPQNAVDEFLVECRSDNGLLMQLTGRDVGALGYPLAPK